MKTILFLTLLSASSFIAKAQKVDSIYFNLYTDSLKKGVHNYINVDGKMSNGKWAPLTSKDLIFTTTVGKFEGNDVIIPQQFSGEYLEITATLKSNSAITRSIHIWMKKLPDPDKLPTAEEIMNRRPQQDSTKTKSRTKSKN